MTNYANGTAFENRVKDELTEDGYWCVRAAGSRGVADLVAIKPGQILIVQVKRTGRTTLLTPKERAELVEVARICRALPIVAYREAPRKPVRFRRLTGTGPADWVPWVPDEVAAS